MISSRTCGRLGNFLFQFAATYCHAKKNGFNYCMPKRSMNERLWPTPKFKNIKYCGPQPGRLYQEPSPAYSPIPDEDNLILEGYYQSEKYWHGFHKEIAEVLELLGPGIHERVGVHVRRGDYLRFPDEFPVLPGEYYLLAFRHMINTGEIGKSRFKIFSDDIKWCKTFFQSSDFSGMDIIYSEGQSALQDMKDVFCMESMIIANSSFSLFPALLRSDNPLVIAPAEHRWFGPANKKLDSPDRMAERFIKL